MVVDQGGSQSACRKGQHVGRRRWNGRCWRLRRRLWWWHGRRYRRWLRRRLGHGWWWIWAQTVLQHAGIGRTCPDDRKRPLCGCDIAVGADSPATTDGSQRTGHAGASLLQEWATG